MTYNSDLIYEILSHSLAYTFTQKPLCCDKAIVRITNDQNYNHWFTVERYMNVLHYQTYTMQYENNKTVVVISFQELIW